MNDKQHDIIKKALAMIATQWKPENQEQEELLRSTIAVDRYEKEEVVFKEMETPSFICYLIEGKVKICKNGLMGKSRIIRVVKPCDPFGYRAFFDNQYYATAAMTLEDSLIAKIPLTTVTAIMRYNYSFAMSLIKNLARELGISDMRTINLTQKHVRGRLAEALIYLKDGYGMDNDGRTLSLKLTREELANLSNMTTNNAIRTLSAFASEGLVQIDGRKISIMKEEELRRISDFG